MPPPPPEPSPAPRLGRAPSPRSLAALASVALAALFLWPLWAGAPADRTRVGPAGGDFQRQFHPYRAFVARSWAHLSPPLWNPHQYAGTPALADPQQAALYPFRLPQALIALAADPLPLWAVQLEALLHLALGGLFTALLVRRLGSGWAGAAAGGLAFGLGGYLTGYPLQQLAVLDTAVWLPATLGALAGWLRPDGRRRDLALALGAGLMLVVAGHPQTAMFGLWAILAWLVALGRTGGLSRRDWLARSGAWLAGVAGLGAAQWLPSASFLAQSARSLSAEELAAGLPPMDSVQLLAPHAVSQWSPLYVGILALPLAVFALRHARGARFFGLLAAAGWLVALGGHNPLFPVLIRVMPGMALFRHQERAAVLASLGLAVAAGLGLDALRRGGAESAGRLARPVGGFVLALVLAAAALTLATRDTPPVAAASACVAEAEGAPPGPAPADAGWLARAAPLADPLAFSALMMALGLAVLRLTASGRWAPRRGVWAMTTLLGLELVSVNRGRALCPVEAAPAPTRDPILAALLPHARDGRVSSEARLPGGPNAASLWSLQDVTGDSPLQLGGTADLVARAPEIVWWRILGVRYLVTARPPAGAPLAELARRPAEGEAEAVALYEVGLPADPVWVPRQVTCGEMGARPPWLQADYDPRTDLHVAASPGCDDPPMPDGATARLTILDGSSATMEAVLPADGWLVWSAAYDPGWRARAVEAGGRELALRPAAAWGAVMAVPLPAGAWTLQWTYRPMAVHLGLALSLLTALLLMAAARRPRRAPAAPV